MKSMWERACFPQGKLKSSEEPHHAGWAGRPRALPQYADFSLARRLCWAWDAKRFGQTPATSQKCCLLASGRKEKCAGGTTTMLIPPTAGSSHLHKATWTI